MAPLIFDENDANTRCGRMWRRLGGIYERVAYDLAAKRQPREALDAARRAEVCFWQATGGLDCTLMKEVAGDSSDVPF